LKNIEFLILINNKPWNESTAGSNRILSIIGGLLNEGLNLKLLVYGPSRNNQEKQRTMCYEDNYSKYSKSILPYVVDGYLKVRVYNYLVKYVIQPFVIKTVINECKSADIIWLDNTVFSLRLAKVLRRKFPNVILFMEQSEFLDVHKNNKGNILQRWEGDKRMRLFEKEVFSILDGLGLMTKTLLAHYESFPKPLPKMLHLPMTVDLERFSQIAPTLTEFQKPYIAFVGVMNDAKDGVNILLESFAKIADEFSKYKMYLVGGWNYDTPAHINFIKENRLEDRVFWMKEYPRDSIPAIICNADLLVLPRPNSKQAQGGFPTKLGEYLASGNPVCATTVGELPDYLRDDESVFFAEPGSVESFAQAMKRALIDPENAQRVGLKGMEIAQKEFNKDIQAKKLYQFLLDLQKKQND
jgi:glycosyltransferase involved in cell wall biosynthesis